MKAYLYWRLKKVFYGWWIVAASFFIALYVGGVVFYGFTAFFEPIADDLGWSYTQISLAASLRGLEIGLLAPAWRQTLTTNISLNQSRVGIHLWRQEPEAHKLLVKAIEENFETFTPDALDKVSNSGMVKDLIVNGEEAEPAKSNIL